MNYYERHLGDYAKNCGHLSLLEHGVYVRLLDVYYTKEEPIHESKAARLIGAATPETLQALQVVLDEFFLLRNGYWHQDRADADIAAYTAGKPEREVKKANEDNRLQRHRDERSALFKILVSRGEHAPWNIGIQDLRKLVSAVAAHRPATQPATATATPATATHSPVPNHQYPEAINQSPSGNTLLTPQAQGKPAAKAPAKRGERLPEDWVLPKPWGEEAMSEFPAWTTEKVRTEAAKFRDHWIAKSGKDATKLDWQATWRNWCRSSIAHRDDPKPGAQPFDKAARDAEAMRLLGITPPPIPNHTEVIDA